MGRKLTVWSPAPDGNCLFNAVLRAWLSATRLDGELPVPEIDPGAASQAFREMVVLNLVSFDVTDQPLVYMLLTSQVPSLPDIVVRRHRRLSGLRCTALYKSGAHKGETVEEYARRMARDGEWAGQSELISAAHMLSCRIVVRSDDMPTQTYGDGPIKAYLMLRDSHYSALIRASDDDFSAV